MNTTISVATMFAITIAASPLAAQIVPRTGDSRSGRTSRDRIETVQDAIEAARTRGSIYGDSRTSSQSRVPKGHLPPRGMCRIWIDGVPPGHQPEPTSCAQAERDRFRYSNARVIYGDRESFPGKGKGKWDRTRDDDDILRDGGILRDGRILRADSDDSDHARGKSKSKAGKARGRKADRG